MVSLDTTTLQLVGIFEAQAHGHPEGTIVRMTCYSANYVGEIKASAEIAEVRWLNCSDKAIISEVDKIIFDFLQQKNLLD